MMDWLEYLFFETKLSTYFSALVIVLSVIMIVGQVVKALFF